MLWYHDADCTAVECANIIGLLTTMSWHICTLYHGVYIPWYFTIVKYNGKNTTLNNV